MMEKGNHMKLIQIIISLMLCIFMQYSYAENYLLKPTGKYGVGFQDITVVNTNICPDSFYHSNINEKDFDDTNKHYCHEIILRVYYPLSKIPKLYSAFDAPNAVTFNHWITHQYDLTKKEINQLNSLLKVNTYTKANDASYTNGKFPIIIFSPGSSSPAQIYTNLITHLVSHGYIVIGVNSMFINGSLQKFNGHVVQSPNSYEAEIGRKENLDDLKFTLNNIFKIPFQSDLKKHMNFDMIGLMGHSRGGMSIVNLLNQYSAHPKIKAVILMDPGNNLGIKNYPIFLPEIPTLVMWSASFKDATHGSTVLKKNVHNFVILNKNQDKNYSNHNNFCDFSTLQYHPGYSNLNVHRELTVGTGNGVEIAKIINEKILVFFDTYLKK